MLRYAPRSGEETRELVADKGRERKGKATDAIEDARDFIGGTKAESVIVVEGGKEARREARAKHLRAAEPPGNVRAALC